MLKDEYTAVNIRDYLLDNHSEITGEQILINLFSGFSCPLNPNVEKFLKENADFKIDDDFAPFGRQLLPNTDNTDGFFIAPMERK